MNKSDRIRKEKYNYVGLPYIKGLNDKMSIPFISPIWQNENQFGTNEIQFGQMKINVAQMKFNLAEMKINLAEMKFKLTLMKLYPVSYLLFSYFGIILKNFLFKIL